MTSIADIMHIFLFSIRAPYKDMRRENLSNHRPNYVWHRLFYASIAVMCKLFSNFADR